MRFVTYLTNLDVSVAAVLFVTATAAVALVAPRLTREVDALARRTTFGHSLAGSVLLGASTSLPGIIVTVVATLRGDVALAAANAVGGVAAQTTFLAVADAARRPGPLLQRAATAKALTQLGVLLVLLAVPLFAIVRWPEGVVGRLHPASIALVVIYLVGLWAARREPGAEAGTTDPDADDGAQSMTSMPRLWAKYIAYVGAIAIAGLIIGTTISPIASAIGLTSIAAGGLITAGVTSSPELITSVSAARRGKPHLAVGDVVGGNTFDILFLACADAVLATSLYAKLGPSVVLLIAAAILLNAIVLLGFVRARGEARISPESVLMLVLYLALATALLTT